MRPFKSILMPMDYSATADVALGRAALLAKQLRAHLLVIHVVPPHDPLYFEYVGVSPASGNGAQKRALEKLSGHVAKVLGKPRVRAQIEIAWGDAAQQIVETAAERGCDLIVMGRNGESPWDRLLIGSVADKVVRNAPCAVLTVAKPQPAQVKSSRIGGQRRPAQRTRRVAG